MSVTGEPEGAPMKAGYAVADIYTGLYASVGILSALRRRDATGEGATLDMALLDSAGRGARQPGDELSGLGQAAGPARQRPPQYRAL